VRKLAFLALLCLPAVSQAWWNDEWNFRKEITFDLSKTGANIAGTLQDVPVLIRLHAGNFGYFADAKPDGSDFRVIDGDDKTPLQFHFERFDAVNQLAFLWVRLPRIAGGTNGQKLFIYYGNPKANAAGDPGATYDKNQSLVLHFSDPQIADSTAFANKPAASTAESNVASLIGGGLKMGGAQSVIIPATNSIRLVPAEGATLSSWVRLAAAQSDAYLLALQDQAAELIVGVRGLRPYARLSSAAGKAEAAAPEDFSAAEWHHVAASYSSGQLTLYVDGVAVSSAPAQASEIGGQLTIGAGKSSDHFLAGELDEVQFSHVARSTDWVAAAARSQGIEAPLVVYGVDAQREAQKVSYFRVTLSNVTSDGWVVIGILAVMFVLALMVMVSKALYLARVSAGNTAFLRAFETARDAIELARRPMADEAKGAPPATQAGEADARRFRQSTIYQIYLRGTQEIANRIDAQSVSARAVATLSPQSVDAMRAAMDATQVRMGQKLGSGMVLLTIAIAGGPFLGLLGTVVGVMITFAAIAATGDVNVNAIAPGIAAALVATVAGLGVAIPALFGYNWLNTRIKEINADMRVFVDEFITRVAEQYAD
jgi:biopolymer transport protein ExbB